MPDHRVHLPRTGLPREELLSKLQSFRANDANWKDGRTWSLVYYAGEEITELLQSAYLTYFHENGLGPMAFPSLQRLEGDVIAMAAGLLGGDDQVVGNMTTGGTESILMAVKTARDLARSERPEVTAPEVVLPESAHPAFLKACHYFCLTPVRVPAGPDLRVDPVAMRAAITPNTVMLVGSAPSYPHGVIDPIAELSGLALETNIYLHVDACVGGFLLPFARKLGCPVPPFHFELPGVRSISADIHKYGFGAKGASVVLYRNKEIRRHQYFVFTDWSGGVYASPTMPGTRAGGPIAAAWAILNHLGEEGYLGIARQIMETTRRLQAGIAAIPGLRILGEPAMSIFAFTSDELDVLSLADLMDQRGWHLDRQQWPTCLHMMVTTAHTGVVDQFLSDLRACADEARLGPVQVEGGKAALYGAMATIADRAMVKDVVLSFMDEWTKVKA